MKCLAGAILILVAGTAYAGPLHDAAIEGDVVAADRLLDAGADVNEDNGSGAPLIWALFGQNRDVALLLLRHGTNPNAAALGSTPLVSAIHLRDAELISALLNAGADIHGSGDETPLMASSVTNDVSTTQLLLDRGADPNHQTASDGLTALHVAAGSGSLSAAQVLLEHGAELDRLTWIGQPPIHFAAAGGHSEVVELFKTAGWVPGSIEPVSDLMAHADPERGKHVGDFCLRCHRIDASNEGRIGAYFWNIVGRPVATLEDFNYSSGLQSIDGIWDYETLNRFIARPFEIAPGTYMDAGGLADVADRADFIAYLRTLSDAPVPLP